MKNALIIFLLLLAFNSYSQCEIEEIIINVKDTLHVETEIDIVDIYAFDPNNEYDTFATIERRLDSLDIDYNESSVNRFKISINSKHYVIKTGDARVKESVEKLIKDIPGIGHEYQLKQLESKSEIFIRETRKAESQAYLSANFILSNETCSIKGIKSIELVASEINDKEILDDNLAVTLGWNTQLDFNTSKQLIKHFHYRYTFKLK